MTRLQNKVLRRLSGRASWYPFLTVESGVGAGLRLRLRNASADYSVGSNELPVQEAVREHVRTGGVFYDIGSNVGFFSLIAARLVGPTGSVHAFEPVPDNLSRIRENAERNGLRNITAWPVAVGRSHGTETLRLARHPGGATLSSADVLDPVGAIEVRVVSIDGLVAGGELPAPTFAKIDVEGTETDVLDGMKGTIADHRPTLLIEVDDADAEAVRRKFGAVQDRLVPLGYSCTPLERSYGDSDWHVGHVVATPDD